MKKKNTGKYCKNSLAGAQPRQSLKKNSNPRLQEIIKEIIREVNANCGTYKSVSNITKKDFEKCTYCDYQ